MIRDLLPSLALFLFIAGCGSPVEPSPGVDGGGDAGTPCAGDPDCDDGLFCTGEELCLPRSPRADARGCATDTPPCGGAEQTCDEATDRCLLDCAVTMDADGDGEPAPECGGDDCDDLDPMRHPGALEVCDPDGVDEDCDPSTFGARDGDGDGYPDARCCNGVGSAAEACGDDCDDESASVHPTEAETCNELDDDCDGAIDETVTIRYVADGDRDGHGSEDPAAATRDACRAPAGFAERVDDCDDTVASVHPGAYDRCDAEGTAGAGVDDDCSGTPNDPPGGCACTNGSARTCPRPGACGASTQTCVSGAWSECAVIAVPETCDDGIDQDCDGAVDDGCECSEDFRFCGTDEGACMRGIQLCASDGSWGPCADVIGPAPETCNTIDDDCDASVDEGVFVRCWADTDGDGYSITSAIPIEMCAPSCPTGSTPRDPAMPSDRDCDPADARVHPGPSSGYGTPRTTGGYDYDCDGAETRTETASGNCAEDSSGRCLHGGGQVTTGGCGAQVDFIGCADVDHGSAGTSCDEVFRCSAGATTCGDQNRVRCR